MGWTYPYGVDRKQLVVVARKSDGVKGSLYFQATPRLYFGFKAN